MIYLMIRLLGSLHASHIFKLSHDMNVPKLTTNEIMHILHNQRAEKFRGIIFPVLSRQRNKKKFT